MLTNDIVSFEQVGPEFYCAKINQQQQQQKRRKNNNNKKWEIQIKYNVKVRSNK